MAHLTTKASYSAEQDTSKEEGTKLEFCRTQCTDGLDGQSFRPGTTYTTAICHTAGKVGPVGLPGIEGRE